jgi:hypothetical protein
MSAQLTTAERAILDLLAQAGKPVFVRDVATAQRLANRGLVLAARTPFCTAPLFSLNTRAAERKLARYGRG